MPSHRTFQGRPAKLWPPQKLDRAPVASSCRTQSWNGNLPHESAVACVKVAYGDVGDDTRLVFEERAFPWGFEELVVNE